MSVCTAQTKLHAAQRLANPRAIAAWVRSCGARWRVDPPSGSTAAGAPATLRAPAMKAPGSTCVLSQRLPRDGVALQS